MELIFGKIYKAIGSLGIADDQEVIGLLVSADVSNRYVELYSLNHEVRTAVHMHTLEPLDILTPEELSEHGLLTLSTELNLHRFYDYLYGLNKEDKTIKGFTLKQPFKFFKKGEIDYHRYQQWFPAFYREHLEELKEIVNNEQRRNKGISES